MKIAYIQSIGGASGDMLLGALVDAGLPVDALRNELAKLPVARYSLEVAEETRCEVRGTHLKVKLEDRTRHAPMTLVQTVENSGLPHATKEQAIGVLRSLWRAEARVHGEPEDALELEELGTVDTLVDVVGFCVGLRELGVEKVYAAPLVLGEATPPRRAGGYANPAPATLELVCRVGRSGVCRQSRTCGSGRAHHADGSSLDHCLGGVSPSRVFRASGGCWLGNEGPAWIRQRAAHLGRGGGR